MSKFFGEPFLVKYSEISTEATEMPDDNTFSAGGVPKNENLFSSYSRTSLIRTPLGLKICPE